MIRNGEGRCGVRSGSPKKMMKAAMVNIKEDRRWKIWEEAFVIHESRIEALAVFEARKGINEKTQSDHHGQLDPQNLKNYPSGIFPFAKECAEIEHRRA